ncbi:MAG: hypothetical protein NC320_06270 [Clostridium sp.]|nr:hypothetical protein [Clostridium sp.]MCM1547615.1 hypothetical protein [Ruminococcus sp.]
MKRIVGIISCISGSVLVFYGAFIIGRIIFNKSHAAIIGGADTPTFMFIIHNSGMVLPVISVIAGFLLIALSCILLLKRKR